MNEEEKYKNRYNVMKLEKCASLLSCSSIYLSLFSFVYINNFIFFMYSRENRVGKQKKTLKPCQEMIGVLYESKRWDCQMFTFV